MSSIAIIPARGGSKRIPGKNKKLFLGKPIITYSIEAALQSSLFDEVMVSTDDPEIAEIAKQLGASVPFLRSSETSNDLATLAEVIQEVLATYNGLNKNFDTVCCVLPTAPFVSSEMLRLAYTKLQDENLEVVFPVVAFSFPIQRALKIKDQLVSMLSPKYMNSRSQDLEERYHDAGQFYILNTNAFQKEQKIYLQLAGAIIASPLKVQDIDTETDWKLAEMKYKLD
jgi:pseudaminic acid cytidylyltransferase|tara:strand:- start:574 stop:1254 length:681 start_codon:yes stop_codon:yes gene_type:complete